MGKSQETFNKKEKEKKRIKKRQDKLLKKEDRKANAEGGGLENMMAYVDENGMISDTPPDPTKKKKVIAANIEIGVPKRDDIVEDPIKNGRVDFFNDQKGFGFIKELDTQEKYFVHVNGTLEEIRENDLVEFELERGMKGMNAVRVKIIKEPRKKIVPVVEEEALEETEEETNDTENNTNESEADTDTPATEA
jgi:cold shock CspA family protein